MSGVWDAALSLWDAALSVWDAALSLWDAVLLYLASLDWKSITGSVLLSLAASALFWTLTFKISLTSVRFSPKLEKSPNTQGGSGYRYRVRIINLGRRDLIEVSVIVKMTIDLGSVTRVLHLECGNQNFLPILRRWRRPAAGDRFRLPTLTLSVPDSAFPELKRTLYTDHIRISASRRNAGLDDIFQEYADKVTIQLFLYGNDRVTGARRLFTSPAYTIADLQEGTFHSAKELSFQHFSRKKKIEAQCFQIDDPPAP